MAKDKIAHLTRREREIISTVFALGNSAAVEDIRRRLESPPSGSSVRVMLARLEAKGIVRRPQEGIRNIYSVTVSPASAKRRALHQYLQTFFGGSLRLMQACASTYQPYPSSFRTICRTWSRSPLLVAAVTGSSRSTSRRVYE